MQALPNAHCDEMLDETLNLVFHETWKNLLCLYLTSSSSHPTGHSLYRYLKMKEILLFCQTHGIRPARNYLSSLHPKYLISNEISKRKSFHITDWTLWVPSAGGREFMACCITDWETWFCCWDCAAGNDDNDDIIYIIYIYIHIYIIYS